MGRWEIKEIESDELGAWEVPSMRFTIEYYGSQLVDATDEMHRAVSYLNGEMFTAYPVSIDYDIRSRSLSLKPDAPDFRRKIEKVIFNDPATIIIWRDGTKTVVKASEGEVYDPEKGFAMVIAKFALGNKGNYYETFKKWLPEEENYSSGEWTLDEALSWFKNLSTKATEITEKTFAKYMNPPEEENDIRMPESSQRLTITITPSGNIDGYIPGSDMAKIWEVDNNTIRMWVHRGKLSFPDCIRLGTREYFIKLGTQKPEEKKRGRKKKNEEKTDEHD